MAQVVNIIRNISFVKINAQRLVKLEAVIRYELKALGYEA